ncbi:MAG: DNA translocase FtsK [Clostridia bacterium]
MTAKKDITKSQAGKSGTRKASNTRAINREIDRRQREIAGIVLIAVGVLLGAYMFFTTAGYLGEVVMTFLFGICGIVAYGLPLVFIGMGILSIKGGSDERMRGSAWFVLLGVLALITLMQVTQNIPYRGVSYMDYLNGAYTSGTMARQGGGFVGGVLCYPIQLLGGNVLAYTMLIALILISVVAVTGLSIRDMSTKVGETMQTAAQSAVDTAHDVQIRMESSRERKMTSFDLSAADGQKKRERKAGVSKPLPAPKKISKRKKAEMLDELDELISFLPFEGELPMRTDIKSTSKKPVPVVSDIWNDVEPVVDAPLVIRPMPNEIPVREELPLPDTEQLFGTQSKSAPRKIKDLKQAQHPPEKPFIAKADVANLPEVTFSNTSAYEPPSFTLLNSASITYGRALESPNEKARLLVEALESFHVSAKVTNICVGPVLTRFELLPAPGVRVARITSLSNDIALALAAQRVRIEAPIPGKNAIGIEIPNKDTVTVVLRDIVESKEFMSAKSAITLALGKDISGKVVVADLGKMPHMLIAGATGSGKSVCINDIIISMIYKSSPADVKMILIDPKMVELSVFGTLPHLLIPVVTDPKKASSALRWAVNEMTQRYKKFSEIGCRDLARYNEMMDTPENRLPKLVVIIDELADLMMVAPDEVEDSICRIAQLGRASGIHLIVATQRPSADIITGLIKANIPSRCAFAVSSGIDSRIILDSTGAEKLLGRGDMLFHPNGANKPMRLQCAFVSDEEVERIVAHFKKTIPKTEFDEQIIKDMSSVSKNGPNGGVFGEGKQDDELLGEGLRIVLESGQASISMIQRRLRVGYARAARLIDIMEQHGYVSGFDGSKPRKVLIKRSEFEELFGDGMSLAGEEPTEE